MTEPTSEPMAAMQYLITVYGYKLYWADPKWFTKPGLYYWNGKKNVHIENFPIKVLEETQNEYENHPQT